MKDFSYTIFNRIFSDSNNKISLFFQRKPLKTNLLIQPISFKIFDISRNSCKIYNNLFWYWEISLLLFSSLLEFLFQTGLAHFKHHNCLGGLGEHPVKANPLDFVDSIQMASWFLHGESIGLRYWHENLIWIIISGINELWIIHELVKSTKQDLYSSISQRTLRGRVYKY